MVASHRAAGPATGPLRIPVPHRPRFSKISLPKLVITAPNWLSVSNVKLTSRRSVAAIPFAIVFAVSAFYLWHGLGVLYGTDASGNLPPLVVVRIEGLALIATVLVVIMLMFSESVVRMAGIKNDPAQPWGYATAVERASERFEDFVLHSKPVWLAFAHVMALALCILICYVA